ncbi:unnamed protein product [Parascedosporium putredinis]|uniref:Fumarylacetoacetase-like C-terminal domain-containing protein n=1 Tax=Parascedosporium putredinis TaxID=1442378 RepID=A0A9P1M8G7_9PEZI|nr:unnamed protein product [Parascedosporium putredinis]CAI7993535.1 unnamed protein product [Parascedosporium putredinis]
MAWSRLIRFVDDNGKETFGEPCIDKYDQLNELLEKGELYAVEYAGQDPTTATQQGAKVHVKELKDILKPSEVPIVKCIGLNYIKHRGRKEASPFPSVFIKPSACVAGFKEDIPIPKIAQDGTVDYEGELAVVIGKTGKDITKENALDHVLGYLASNDVSARAWQRDPAKAGGVPQWCFSKGFDNDLLLQTFVNGEERQNSTTGDLLFGVKEIVSFVSQGTTLQAGTIILTGTPLVSPWA